MTELLSDPAVWASFFTLTILEIVLGVDNVIFISIAANRLPENQRRLGRSVGLLGRWRSGSRCCSRLPGS